MGPLLLELCGQMARRSLKAKHCVTIFDPAFGLLKHPSSRTDETSLADGELLAENVYLSDPMRHGVYLCRAHVANVGSGEHRGKHLEGVRARWKGLHLGRKQRALGTPAIHDGLHRLNRLCVEISRGAYLRRGGPHRPSKNDTACERKR